MRRRARLLAHRAAFVIYLRVHCCVVHLAGRIVGLLMSRLVLLRAWNRHFTIQVVFFGLYWSCCLAYIDFQIFIIWLCICVLRICADSAVVQSRDTWLGLCSLSILSILSILSVRSSWSLERESLEDAWLSVWEPWGDVICFGQGHFSAEFVEYRLWKAGTPSLSLLNRVYIYMYSPCFVRDIR